MSDKDPAVQTFFDSPERKGETDIDRQTNAVLKNKILSQVIEILPEQVIILNSDRQIIAASKNTNDIIKSFVQEDLRGLRLGEAIGCIYSNEMDGECGTSKYCTMCGAGQAIKISKDTSEPCTKECNISTEIDGKKISYNFSISTKVFNDGEEKYILVFLKDIADTKHRALLEKIFYHDVLNIATGIDGLSGILTEIEDKTEIEEISQTIQHSVKNLINEILAQRNLTEAENGILNINQKPVNLTEILRDVSGLFGRGDLAAGKNISVIYPENPPEILTDRVLLNRSLTNLVKNALEATEKGGEVEIYSEFGKDFLRINVKNEGVIPEDIQLQIFQRSFSTKSKFGRGVGTYSVKLLVEQYLKGKVSFISKPETQTIFTIEIPLKN